MPQLQKYSVDVVVQAMDRCGGDRNKAASLVGCSRATLQNKINDARRAGITVVGVEPKPRVIFPPSHQEDPLRPPTTEVVIDRNAIDLASAAYGRRLEIHIASGNWAACHAVIDSARREAIDDDPVEPLLEVAIADSGVDLRAANRLEEKAGVILVGELLGIGCEEMLKIPNFGPTGLDGMWKAILIFSAGRDAQRREAVLELKELKQ